MASVTEERVVGPYPYSEKLMQFWFIVMAVITPAIVMMALNAFIPIFYIWRGLSFLAGVWLESEAAEIFFLITSYGFLSFVVWVALRYTWNKRVPIITM